MKRALVVTAWLAAAPLFAAGAELEVRLWSVDLSGTVRVDDGAAGSVIDLESELGIGSDEPVEVRLVWRPSKKTSVRLGWASLGFTGEAELEESVTFGGQTFLLNSVVASSLDFDYARADFAWQFLANGDATVRFGPMVGARGLRGDATLSTNLLGVLPLSVSESFEFGFGAAGVVLDVEPSRKIHLYAEWSTLVTSDEGDLTDLEAAVRYYPLDRLAVTAGYRAIAIDVREGDDLLDVDLDGPFFGIVLRF